MIVYKDKEYGSKAAVVRAMFDAGDMDNSPDQKKRVALLLGMTVQTVHATLVNYKKIDPSTLIPPVLHPVFPPVVKMPSGSIRELINARFNECYKIAKSKGVVVDLPFIEVRWNLRGRTAGQFGWKSDTEWFDVNLPLAEANLEDYLAQVVPHEFCHYIDYMSWKRSGFNSWQKPKAHGLQWKHLMLSVFGRIPERCHHYDTSAVAGSRSHYKYKCACRSWAFGAVRHRRLQMNSKRYWCPKCKGHLTFVG